MVKIAILVPNEGLFLLVRDYVREKALDIVCVKEIRTENAVSEARRAISDGARVIVALGEQADLIKKYTNVPVVLIRLHAQEIGLLLQRAKAIVKKENPKVCMIAYENMLCDMSYMGELFGVQFSVAYIDKVEMITQRLTELSKDKPDIIIGGELTCAEAQKMGYHTLNYRATWESISESVIIAKSVAEATETESQYAAQFETVLDTSFSGIIKINLEGKIIVVNKVIENILAKSSIEITGLPLTEVFPEFDMSAVNRILSGERDDFIVSVSIRNQAWMLMVAPIQYDEQITGAILSLHRVGDSFRKEMDSRRDMFLHGYTASATFRQISTENKLMKEVLERARIYALSESPVLIYTEEGTEYYMIAEAMHNNSIRKTGPFLSISAIGMNIDQQMQIFFGGDNYSEDLHSRKEAAFVRANHGTIFIRDVENLTLPVQYQICRTLSSHELTKTDVQPIKNIDVRIIASTRENMNYLVKEGKICEEFYFLIQGLTLDIPGLNQRPEDLLFYFEKFVREYSKEYKKRLVITDAAREKIKQLSWKGNLIQLKSFCERLVLTAEKRRIDEGRIQNLYGVLYPHVRESAGEEKIVVYKSPEAVAISAVLEKHGGNRTLAAQELGISTTTLWRRMKKYGIEKKHLL
jgi:transcriptional regulator with PAS, ATPase and Fis domain